MGLETSEMPIIAAGSSHKILKNTTIAIEPKFVVEDLGIIGIENTLAVDGVNFEKLTKIPEQILIA